MKPSVAMWATIAALSMSLMPSAADTRRQMEGLGRGVIAINQGEGKVWISWRLLGTDPEGIAFNLYRSAAGPHVVRCRARDRLTRSG